MIWILAGVVLVVALGVLVCRLVLDDVAENHEGPGVVPYDPPSRRSP